MGHERRRTVKAFIVLRKMYAAGLLPAGASARLERIHGGLWRLDFHGTRQAIRALTAAWPVGWADNPVAWGITEQDGEVRPPWED